MGLQRHHQLLRPRLFFLLLCYTLCLSASAGGSEGLQWRPRPGKYLLAYCLYGRLTNQIFCMRDYLAAARILNRTLLVPTYGVAFTVSHALAYQFHWNTAVDWRRMQQCLAPVHGPHAVMTTDDYLALHQTKTVNVTRFDCIRQSEEDGPGKAAIGFCYGWNRESGEFKKLHAASLAIPSIKDVRNTPLPKRPSAADLRGALGDVADDVITLGELFNLRVQQLPPSELPPLETRGPECSNLWHPSPAIMGFVEGIKGSLLGDNYAAVHFRRGDFYKYMLNSAKERHRNLTSLFQPVTEAAAEMRRKLQELQVPNLYIASNARRLELEMYKAVVREPGDNSSVQLVYTLADVLQRQEWLNQQPWARKALELETMEGGLGLVLSLIDKYMCVAARHFFGAQGSTFSAEISWFLRPAEMH